MRSSLPLTLLSLALLFSPPLLAGQKAGVALPDQITLGGSNLVLNGMGLREAYLVDIYVGALYLPTATRSSSQAINADVPKRIVMHFIFSKISRDQQIQAFRENLAKNPEAAAVASKLEHMYGLMEEIHAGEEVVLDYVPGTGTTIRIRGRDKATVQGVDFMKVVWSFFIGPQPASAKLKTGLLGL